MIDYIVERQNTLLLTAAVLMLVSLVEILSLRSDASKYLRQKPSLRDRFLNVAATAAFLIIGGYLASLIIHWMVENRVFRPSGLNTFVYIVLFLLLQDGVYYFYHRLQHQWSFLWGLHKLHHTDTDVNITTSHRAHLLESPLQLLIVYTPPLLILGIHPQGLLVATYIGLFFLYFSHSRLSIDLGPLAQWIVGPQYHRIHHSCAPEHINTNFAQYFSLLDRLFGTFTRPEPISEVKTGVSGSETLIKQWLPLAWPLTHSPSPQKLSRNSTRGTLLSDQVSKRNLGKHRKVRKSG